MQTHDSLNRYARATIGIVTGSGPEAGLDLWAKILKRNKATIGADFQGAARKRRR